MPIYVDSNASGANDGTSWTDAYSSIDNAGVDGAAADSEIWVAHNHSESTGAVTLNFSNATVASPIRMLSVNSGTDAYQAGASVTMSSALNIQGEGVFIAGITFDNSSGGGSGDVNIGSTGGRIHFEGCVLTTGDLFTMSGSEVFVELIGCTLNIGEASGTGFNFGGDNFVGLVKNCTINHTGVATFTENENSARLVVEDCVLPDADTLVAWKAVDGPCEIIFRRCKLPTSFATVSGTVGNSKQRVLVDNCSSSSSLSDPELGVTEHVDFFGTVKSTLSVYRTDGANDGENANAYSWEMATSANATEIYGVLESPPIAVWVDPDTSPSGATAQGLFQTTRANPLATPAALTTDSGSTWNGSGVGTKQKIDVTIGDYSFTVYVASGTTLNDDDFWVEVSAPDQVGGPCIIRCFLAKPSTTVYVDPKVTVA